MKQKILFGICLLFGLMFINAGLNKFFNYMPVPEDIPEASMQMFMAMMQIKWLMPLVGTAETIGGVLFIIPRFRALGAVILTPVLAGILLANFTVAPEGLPIALTLFAIYLWVVFENKNRYLSMIN